MGTLLFPTLGPPALPPQKRKKTSDSLTATISCGSSFLALSLLPPSAICSQSLDFPLQELGMGRKEQGGPDFGMFLLLCAPPSFLAPGLLLPITIPSGVVLKGRHRVMSNRSCLGRLTSCLPFPPNLTAKKAIPCSACANPLPAHGGEAQLWGKAQSWSGKEFHFPALERPSMDSFTSCGMKEGRSSAARASSPCMLYLWKLGAGQQA